jgi:hypothetical protein
MLRILSVTQAPTKKIASEPVRMKHHEPGADGEVCRIRRDSAVESNPVRSAANLFFFQGRCDIWTQSRSVFSLVTVRRRAGNNPSKPWDCCACRTPGGPDDRCRRHRQIARDGGFPDASIRDGMLDVMEQNYCWPRQPRRGVSGIAVCREPSAALCVVGDA